MTEFLKTIPHLLGLLGILLWNMLEAALVLTPLALIPIGSIAVLGNLLDNPDWTKWLYLAVFVVYLVSIVLTGIHYLEKHIKEQANTPSN